MRRMARTMRFHLDEHLPHAIAEGLRRRGIDVTTTVEAGLRGASDDVHLAYALEQRRVIVTNDPDFLVLAQLCLTPACKRKPSDLQHGRRIERLTIENPFLGG